MNTLASTPSVRELGGRLEQEYGPRIARLGATLTLVTTPIEVRIDVAEIGGAEPVLQKWVQYARRLSWGTGDADPYRDLSDLENELRAELVKWIAEREEATPASSGGLTEPR